MALWKGMQAYLWLSQRHIYVMKTETGWSGRICSCQLCTCSCPKGWQNHPEGIQSCLHEAVSIYGLQECTLYLLLSGPALLWKALKLAAKEKDEARSLAVWDEAIGDGSTAYVFDLERTREPAESGMYVWMSGAYPYDMVAAMIAALQEKACRVGRIDVLPALASRLCRAETGILYICEPSLVHCIRLKAGLPISYACASALPDEGRRWQELHDSSGRAIWLDEANGTWSAPPVSAAAAEKMKQWEAAYPEAILMAY